jgi:hypothetical protein
MLWITALQLIWLSGQTNKVYTMKHNQTEIIRAISKGIIQCCIFADKPEGSNPRVTRQAWQAAEAMASKFVGIIGADLLDQAVEAYGGEYGGSYRDTALRYIGHDIWFTMRGPGVGFWDRSFLDVNNLGQQMTEACAKLRHVEPTFYRGWLYLE